MSPVIYSGTENGWQHTYANHILSEI